MFFPTLMEIVVKLVMTGVPGRMLRSRRYLTRRSRNAFLSRFRHWLGCEATRLHRVLSRAPNCLRSLSVSSAHHIHATPVSSWWGKLQFRELLLQLERSNISNFTIKSSTVPFQIVRPSRVAPGFFFDPGFFLFLEISKKVTWWPNNLQKNHYHSIDHPHLSKNSATAVAYLWVFKFIVQVSWIWWLAAAAAKKLDVFATIWLVFPVKHIDAALQDHVWRLLSPTLTEADQGS